MLFFQFINLTPHKVVLDIEGAVHSFEPSGVIARVEDNFEPAGHGLYKLSQGEVQNLPEPKSGIIYIVSAMVFNATDRHDVVAPASGLAHRDDQGRIISVPGFIVK